MLMEVVDEVVTEHRCPSGLRSRTQDAMWQHSRVQIPLCAFFTSHPNSRLLPPTPALLIASIFPPQIQFYLLFGCKSFQYLFIIHTFYYMQTNKTSQRQQFKTKATQASHKTRLLEDLQQKLKPTLARLDLGILQKRIFSHDELVEIKSQIKEVIQFLHEQINRKPTVGKGVNDLQVKINDFSISGEQSKNYQRSFDKIKQDIMKTLAITELQKKHQKQIAELQQQIRKISLDFTNEKARNEYHTSQNSIQQEQLKKYKDQIEEQKVQIQKLLQNQNRNKQLIHSQSLLRLQKNKSHLQQLKQSVSQRLRDQFNSKISNLQSKLTQNQSISSERINRLQEQTNSLQRQLQLAENSIRNLQGKKDEIENKFKNLDQKYNSYIAQFQERLQAGINQNKKKYQQAINNWKQEQITIISIQTKDFFQKLEDAKAPYEQRINGLKIKVQNLKNIEQQLKNTKNELINSEQSSSQKDLTIQSLRQKLGNLNQQIRKKEALIKKIATLALPNRERINEDNIYKKMEEQLADNRQEKQDQQKSYQDEIAKYEELSKELADLKGDIRNINSSLLDSQVSLEANKKLKFACKNTNHIALLSKYNERIQTIMQKNIELTQNLNEEKSKLKKIQIQHKKISDRYAIKQKDQRQLQTMYNSVLKRQEQIKNKLKQIEEQIEEQKNTFEVQKNHLVSSLAAKQQLLSQVNNKLGEANRKSKQIEDKIQDLENSKLGVQGQIEKLRLTNSSCESSILKLKEQIKRLESLLTDYSRKEQLQISNLQQAVFSTTENNEAKSITNFDSLLQFLQTNKPTSKAGPFSFSYILQNLYKEQQKLQEQVKKFLQVPSFSITSSYRYDEFNKNFSNYLPLKSSYHFIIMVRSKKGQIFGAISTGIGKSQRACIFNLNSGKAFESNKAMNSTVFDSGFLIFGQGEMRLKNNAGLEGWVTSKIFNQRCFTFKRDEIVGPNQDGDSVELSGLQIHRIQK